MAIKKCIFPGLCSLVLLASQAGAATILVNENFDHPDGSLVGQAPTPGPGGVWASHSGTLGDLLVSSGQAVVQHGTPSEDANTGFAPVTSGLIIATFDISVSDDTTISGTDSEYFAHFSDGGTSNFYSRLDVVPPSDPNSGDYSLGIATVAGTAEAILPADFEFGDTVGVTLTFDFTTGLSSLTVGGDTISSTSAVFGNTIAAFALRQSDSTNNEAINVDNLVVSYVPEPATCALMAFGILGMLSRRRM